MSNSKIPDLLSKMLVEVKTHAIKLLLTPEQQFVPVVFLLGVDFAHPLPFTFRDGREKAMLVSVICELARRKQAIGIISAMDAWVAEEKHGKMVDLGKIVMPSQRPDRQEALIITATGRDFKKGCCIRYTRQDGKIILGKETDVGEYEDLNFGSLFEDRGFDA